MVDDGLGSGSAARDDPLDSATRDTADVPGSPPRAEPGTPHDAATGDGATGGVPDGGDHSKRAPPTSTANDQVPSGWSEVARGFGLAFTRTGVGREAWFGTMSSWLTPEQAAAYRDVPVEAIPGGRLLRADVSEPGATAHTRGTLTYDTGMVLRVGLSYRAAAGSWLVARVELADTTGTR
ncbi:hypothetical protein C1I92_01465 [Jiangella anatolica]|uniref:Uncharacterized protein n=2 Tax=Jiangella anatolica TaxID=2670374 RepID=A0A2W2BMK2_9ACTN|nr:hypothetical protein C1I92_01465 [Jiangella anatolica]